MKIKTRFSPSPTGVFHIGGARTALYSWLFARRFGGSFVLRIEDTDSDRLKADAISDIINNLSRLGLAWDEGPYFQSKRLMIYQNVISSMLKNGTAYKCYCSIERLEKLRKNQIKKKRKPKYDKKCRKLPLFYKKSNIPYVVRFKNPETGSVEFIDLIRGKIKFLNSELDDLVIQRSNGIPTYNFCVVVDDYHMEITHVIRGEDHINNTPRQINLLKALKKDIPQYAHTPMILDINGKKLSKRNKNTQGITKYFQEGYIPEALLNYIVRLGWSCKDKEIFTLDDMKNLFTFKSVSRSPSILNSNKLLWLNRYYLSHLPNRTVTNYFLLFIKKKNISFFSDINLNNIIKDFIARHSTFQNFLESYTYFYKEFDIYQIVNIETFYNLENIKILTLLNQKFSIVLDWTIKELSNIVKYISIDLQVEYKKIAMLLRISITGINHTPGIILVAFHLGKNRVLLRLSNILKYFNQCKKFI
ncbi:glutamyl-tRNA synthetase [Buchnera aphidicola (Cinara tujafilina)]|uniref:Glutamate--tRNA ligase n=1 Tax=Buchnera aphidicola (Cinara tujafilina) TaxID=261317 RepID=F7WYY4_9GAMM|nr:glutamate--tRNA ligase [Buchnera aphidicola]AEH39634.1 glutamyl-tRNA synthetase [Buchnera aphidicola (Cinara tujafilina)]